VTAAGSRPVTVVTGGAGGGIGAGISRLLAERGHHVVVADVDRPAGESVVRGIAESGGAASFVEVDTADPSSVAELARVVLADLGRVDGLVTSAGVGLVKPAGDVTVEEFDRVLGTDLRGVWLVCRALLPALRQSGHGSIVMIGSNHARATVPGYGVYAAAKSALIGLCRGIAGDYGADGVRCNVLHPGLVDGPSNRRLLGEAFDDVDAWMDGWLTTRQMVPRAIEPDAVGAVVAFLLSEDSRAITATEIYADLGTSALLFDQTDRRATP
jgi:NAD(P)-dependent dehydrogenase (short-subunit alcohol dehydrogenase family)